MTWRIERYAGIISSIRFNEEKDAEQRKGYEEKIAQRALRIPLRAFTPKVSADGRWLTATSPEALTNVHE
jgi:hypothetical protein